MNEDDKKKFGWKSEFSMGQYDFERLHEMLKLINNFSYFLEIGEYGTLRRLYSLLLTFYDDIRPTLVRADKEKAADIDKKFESIKQIIYKADKINNNFRINMASESGAVLTPKIIIEAKNQLLKLKREILDIKQDIGLGLVLEKMQSAKDMLGAGLGVR